VHLIVADKTYYVYKWVPICRTGPDSRNSYRSYLHVLRLWGPVTPHRWRRFS